MKLVLPMYGICDAGNYWGVNMDEHLVNDIGMITAPWDAALYVKLVEQEHGTRKTVEVTGCYVDDSINAGEKDFQDMTMSTLRRFES